MNLNAKIAIEIDLNEVTRIVAEAVKAAYHIDVDPIRVDVKYEGEYDGESFAGFRIHLTTEELLQAHSITEA